MAKNNPVLSFVGEWAEIWLKMASSNTEMYYQQPEMKHKKGLYDHDKYVTMKIERRFSFREVTQARTYVIKTATQQGRAGGSLRPRPLHGKYFLSECKH